MSGRLKDKIAIVTGAGCVGSGWGNGRATAVRFAEEGAKIFAVERDLDTVVETVERVKAVGGEIVECSWMSPFLCDRIRGKRRLQPGRSPAGCNRRTDRSGLL